MKKSKKVIAQPVQKIIRVEGRIVHCPHVWVKDPKVRAGQLCAGCGASCVRNEHGRVIEYDRNWNWGDPIPLEEMETRPQRSSGNVDLKVNMFEGAVVR